MNDNSILKELRETRERLLHPFGGDLTVYLRDLQRRQKELCAGHPLIRKGDVLGNEAKAPALTLKDEPPCPE